MAYVEVEVDLDAFSDEEIREEYKARGLGAGPSGPYERTEILQQVHRLHHMNKKDEAYALLWELCLDDLNKVV